MCSLHLTHPSVHTWSSGQPTVQRPGSSRGLPVGAGIRTHNLGLSRVSSPTLYPLGQRLPVLRRSVCLPVFQGAAVSSEHFSQSLPPRNIAELRDSPPLWASLEQLEQPSPAGPPLQDTELAALSTPEASLERLIPSVDYLAAWRLNGSCTL